MIAYIFAAVLAAVGVILLLAAKSKSGLKGEMDTMTTSSVSGLIEGDHIEVKGVCSCEHPLSAPEADTPCVYYSYQVQRRERRRDSEGRTSHQWRTIDSGEARAPFVLTDLSGSVVVDPEGAKMDAPVLVDREIRPGEDLAGGVWGTILSGAALLAGAERQKIEVRGVAVGRDLYVLGDVLRGADGQLRVAKGEGRFFISTKSEEQLSRSLGWQTKALFIVGALLIVWVRHGG